MALRVIVQNLVTVDGRMDLANPDVKLYYELAAAMQADAMLCGSETMLVAFGDNAVVDAVVDVLPHDVPRNLLVVVDSAGRVKCWDRILASPHWSGGVSLCSNATPAAHLQYLNDLKIPYILAGESHVNLPEALQKLEQQFNVKKIRVDSGGKLNGALMQSGLVNEIAMLLAPAIQGGEAPSPLMAMPKVSDVSSIPLKLLSVETLRNGHVWLRYEVGEVGEVGAIA